MKLFDFNKYFPDEKACRKAFKEMRDREGVVCQHCGSHDVVWLESKQQYQCKHCRHRTTLRSGTVMHGSKLPFMYWFIAMHLLTATKKSISAAELQRQLGHKRYQPIWEMMHKLRSVMGKRDDKYTLKGNIELDEGFFSTETPDSQKQEKLKSGAGSQKKNKVLVIAESTESDNQKRGQKPKKVGHIKMIVVPNLRMVTIDGKAVNAIEPEFLQEYLNEFCYKFNRRYFGEDLFERLVMIAASYRTDFERRAYRKAV